MRYLENIFRKKEILYDSLGKRREYAKDISKMSLTILNKYQTKSPKMSS